jgi:hypothetical protein
VLAFHVGYDCAWACAQARLTIRVATVLRLLVTFRVTPRSPRAGTAFHPHKPLAAPEQAGSDTPHGFIMVPAMGSLGAFNGKTGWQNRKIMKVKPGTEVDAKGSLFEPWVHWH